MIKDDKLGLVIAEDEDEQLWSETQKNCEDALKNIDKMRRFQEGVLEYSKRRLEEIQEERERAREEAIRDGSN